MTQYKAIETFSKVAVAGDATVDYVEFDMPYTPVGIISQVRSVTTGAANTAGLVTTFAGGKIKVAVTALAVGDVVSVIAFA